jgi:hypothetical protein
MGAKVLSRGMQAWLASGCTLAMLLLIVWGIVSHHILSQPIWEPAGLVRLYWLMGAYFALTLAMYLTRKALLPVALLCVMVGLSVASIGWSPLFAIALLFSSALALGDVLLPAKSALDKLLALSCGLAVYATAFGLLAHAPVNRPALWLAALVVPCIWRYRRLPGLFHVPRWTPTTAEFLGAALAGFVLCAHWLVALSPEISADGLAMHLAVPAYIAQHHQWSFDYKTFVWALMPMNGDWMYSLVYLFGSEGAARLANYAFLVTLTGMLFLQVRTMVSQRAAFAVVAVFVSTPLVQHETGSLFIENFWAMLILPSVLALVRYHETGQRQLSYACGILIGAALGTKFGALPYALVIGPLLIAEVIRHKQSPFKPALAWLGFAAPPYVYAWITTGNPCFPFLNRIFHSASFDASAPLVDPRFPSALTWHSLWDATFASSRFLEGQNGSLGFAFLLFLPAAFLLLLTVKREYLPVLAGVLSVVSIVAVFSTQAYLRYFYPSLAIFSLLIAYVVQSTRNTRVYRFYIAALVLFTLLNVYLLPSAGWYHRDLFALWNRESYIGEHAPERLAVDYLNRAHPRAAAAFLTADAVAGFEGAAFTSTWHTPAFEHALYTARDDSAIAELAHRHAIHYFIGPGANSHNLLPSVLVETFLKHCTVPEWSASGISVFLLPDGNIEKECRPDASAADMAAIGPGSYDDRDSRIRFHGGWWRDDQFAAPWQGTLTYSNRPGDELTLRFEGRQITYWFTKAVNRGIAEVGIDGMSYNSVDLYSRNTAWQEHVSWDLPNRGPHELVIRVGSQRNAASSDTFVDVDRFTVQ